MTAAQILGALTVPQVSLRARSVMVWALLRSQCFPGVLTLKSAAEELRLDQAKVISALSELFEAQLLKGDSHKFTIHTSQLAALLTGTAYTAPESLIARSDDPNPLHTCLSHFKRLYAKCERKKAGLRPSDSVVLRRLLMVMPKNDVLALMDSYFALTEGPPVSSAAFYAFCQPAVLYHKQKQ